MRSAYAINISRFVAFAALVFTVSTSFGQAGVVSGDRVIAAPAVDATPVSAADSVYGQNVMWDITPMQRETTDAATDTSEESIAASQIGRASDCCVVGDFDDAFGFDEFFVGNVFSTTNGETITEIKVELDFTSVDPETITYVIYRFDRTSSRYGPQLIQEVPHVGTGQRLYSSGDLDFTLMADTNALNEIIPAFYAIGVGWDAVNTSLITWGRDDDVGGYPRLGCLNTIEGSWGFGDPPPPVGDTNTLSIPVLFPNGVVSMELCTQAPGGGCCLPDGRCVNDVTESECLSALGGAYFGDFSLCETEFCEGVGACCMGVMCQDLTEAECGLMAGTYKGDGSKCSFLPDPCDTNSNGACCRYDGTCEEISEYDCVFDPRLNTPGIFSAPGVECAEAGCEPLGGCCDGFDNCTDVASSGCVLFNCTDTINMAGDQCAPGFMIDTGGLCPILGANPNECIQSTGLEWNQGEPCIHNACFTETSVGACCLLGECIETTDLICQNQGGVFTPQGINGWQACSTNGFPGLCATSNGFDRGACCLQTGCEIRDQASCQSSGGLFQGQQVECSSFICSEGACCFDDMGSNACTNALPLTCASTTGFSGLPQGPGTSCPFDGCNLATGACCGIDGSCTDINSGGCDESAGLFIYQGDGTSCSTTFCQPMGACCGVDGSCSDGIPSSCDEASGLFTFQGVGTTCMSLSCPDTGACCNVDGTCTDVEQANCDVASGFFSYEGDDSACITADCEASGACCLGASCFQATAGDCAQVGTYAGDGTICLGIDSCEIGICCLVDVDTSGPTPEALCLETTRVECSFTQGGLFNDALQMCSTNACPVRGACCTSNGCRELTSFDCANSNGTYIGDGEFCTVGTCQLAACCSNGVCSDEFPDLCRGTPGQPGQLCSSGNLCAPGACCADVLSNGSLVCLTENQLQCQQRNGSFGGAGSTCTLNSCSLGSCCAFDGTCANNVTEIECLGQGDDHSIGQTCAQVMCVDQSTGACCAVDGSCQNGVDQAMCLATGGLFSSGQICAQVSCVDQCAGLSGIRLADFDGDGDIDLMDFAEFQQCFGMTPLSLECQCIFDANLDGVVDLADYAAFEGLYSGIAPPTGSCCHLDGSCDAGVSQAACSVFGGAVFNSGGTCTPNICPDVCGTFSGLAPGDFDGDGDVDLRDYVDLQACFTGSPSDECMCVFDVDEDGTIDIDADYDAFDAAFSGP